MDFIYTYTHAYAYVHIHVHIHICTHAHIHMRTRICTNAYVYIYMMSIFIYDIYTDIHITIHDDTLAVELTQDFTLPVKLMHI